MKEFILLASFPGTSPALAGNAPLSVPTYPTKSTSLRSADIYTTMVNIRTWQVNITFRQSYVTSQGLLINANAHITAGRIDTTTLTRAFVIFIQKDCFSNWGLVTLPTIAGDIILQGTAPYLVRFEMRWTLYASALDYKDKILYPGNKGASLAT